MNNITELNQIEIANVSGGGAIYNFVSEVAEEIVIEIIAETLFSCTAAIIDSLLTCDN